MNIIETFMEFEFQNKLFTHKIQDMNLWPYIRLDVYQMIMDQKQEIGQAHRGVNPKDVGIIQSLKDRLQKTKNYTLKNPLWFSKPADILVINSPRRVKNGKYYECIYTDDLLDNLEHSYQVLELPYMSQLHFTPIKTQNLTYMDSIIKKQYERKQKYINQKLYILTLEEEEFLDDLVNQLNTLFDVTLDPVRIRRMSQSRVLNYWALSAELEKLLDKIQPKLILLVCYYSFSVLLLIELAKKRGIKTVELQHGTMGEYHLAYNFWDQKEFSQFPEYLFLFGDMWKETTRLPINEENQIVTGFPFFERNYKRLDKTDDPSVETILFISQGTVGKELSKVAVDLSHKLDEQKYKIIYRLHPGEFGDWRNQYPWLRDTNIQVIDHNERDIYYYLSQADYQVGVYSTAIIEGLGFNVKTFILKLYGHKNMKYLYSNGFAQLVDSADQISDQLNKSKSKFNHIRKKFWVENSLENMKQAIGLILEE